jgi:HD superfamily phosphohydrolase
VKRIFDPIHHFIELDAAEVALLDTGPLQRLRRLRQLGLAYLVFPAAEHSRFGHALGALAMGERVLEALRGHADSPFADERDYRAQRRLLRVSLLLHDVGHGPFSHACEAVLGVRHEARTKAILGLDAMRNALDALDVDPARVLALVTGESSRDAVLSELVSGPNLDADRMDYLQRDAYFTGVAGGRYDVDQLVGSLRVISSGGGPRLGVDERALVALESFVLARYMMFATVYFHHTTRMFERVLQEALREIWPDPRALDPIDVFLEWDDARVFDELRGARGAAAAALRERHKLYGLAAEFNAERDLSVYDECLHALRARWGEDVWADEQEQLMHRLPLAREGDTPTVPVQTRTGTLDATQASDLIARLTGPARWRKLFLRRRGDDLEEARTLCRRIVASRRSTETAP